MAEGSAETVRRYGKYSVEVSSPGKVLFPDAGITKRDLIEYCEGIAPAMLPHVRGRPVTLRRYPDGVDGDGFYQKNVPDYFPSWIPTVSVKKKDGDLRQLLIRNTATLVYLANQGCITHHVGGSRTDRPDFPDRIIFDLDPSADAFRRVQTAARALRELLTELALHAFVMSSGSRGLHVVVPIARRRRFDGVRDFAGRVAEVAAARRPREITTEHRKDKRKGRVYVDVLRNAHGQHSVAPYSVRAIGGAPVAAPLEWKEALADGMDPRRYHVRNVLRRLARKEDPWKGIGRHASSLRTAEERLESIFQEETRG